MIKLMSPVEDILLKPSPFWPQVSHSSLGFAVCWLVAVGKYCLCLLSSLAGQLMYRTWTANYLPSFLAHQNE